MAPWIYPLVIGFLSGIVYGLFFVIQQKRAFSRLFCSFFSAVRIIILATIWFYLLPWNEINFILVVISFSVTFWCSILIGINRSRYHGWF